MNVEQCWLRYLKGQELLDQGHWPEAHRLFDDVMAHLPTHIQTALDDEHIKPCQFNCLLTGLRDCCIAQAEIFNKLGLQQDAFASLNQTYALFQFLALEQNSLIDSVQPSLSEHSEDLLAHMSAFCAAQRNAQWMLEFEQVSRAHQHFLQLQSASGIPTRQQAFN